MIATGLLAFCLSAAPFPGLGLTSAINFTNKVGVTIKPNYICKIAGLLAKLLLARVETTY